MPDENIRRPGGDKNPQKLSSLHTLTGDTKEFLQEKNISLAALIAQSQKYEKAKGEQRFSYGFYLLVGFAALVIVGGGSFWFLRGYFNKAEEERITKRPKPLFPVYESREILIGVQVSDFINPFRQILSEDILPGRMAEAIVKNKETKKELSLFELFTFAGVGLPSNLSGSLGSRSTAGIFGTIRGTEPVIIVSISSFEKTLAGMLEFEKLLPGALFNFLPTDHPVRRFEFFEDKLIANQEARVLKTADGQPLFAYAFFSRKILILAVSEDALTAVINNFILIPPVL